MWLVSLWLCVRVGGGRVFARSFLPLVEGTNSLEPGLVLEDRPPLDSTRLDWTGRNPPLTGFCVFVKGFPPLSLLVQNRRRKILWKTVHDNPVWTRHWLHYDLIPSSSHRKRTLQSEITFNYIYSLMTDIYQIYSRTNFTARKLKNYITETNPETPFTTHFKISPPINNSRDLISNKSIYIYIGYRRGKFVLIEISICLNSYPTHWFWHCGYGVVSFT